MQHAYGAMTTALLDLLGCAVERLFILLGALGFAFRGYRRWSW